jgi:hypothetical protein
LVEIQLFARALLLSLPFLIVRGSVSAFDFQNRSLERVIKDFSGIALIVHDTEELPPALSSLAKLLGRRLDKDLDSPGLGQYSKRHLRCQCVRKVVTPHGRLSHGEYPWSL